MICAYCRAEIGKNDLLAKRLDKDLYWCNRCKEGSLAFYDKYSREELVILKRQALSTIIYYASNPHIVITTQNSIEIYQNDLDMKKQDYHNISVVLDVREMLSIAF